MISKTRRFAVGVALVGLVVAVTPAVSGASTIGAVRTAGEATTLVPSPNIAVAEMLHLAGGAIAVRTEGGSLVVGPANLSLATAVDEDGLHAVVGMPDPVAGLGTTADGWTEDVIIRFLDEVESGSTLREAAALVEGDRLRAASGPADPADDAPPIIVCQTEGNEWATARQCLTRKHGDDDGTHRYMGDASWTHVQRAEDDIMITEVSQKHTYSKIQTIVQFDPTGTVYMGSCGTISVGVSGHGADIGYSKQICPERMSPDLDTKTESFSVDWTGFRGSAHVEMADMVQVPSASPSLVYYSFAARMVPYCTGYLICYLH